MEVSEPPAQGGVTARVQGKDGWAVRGAVLTVTDLTGRQAARAEGDDEGQVAAGPLAPGTYTAILIAPGYAPAARTAVVTGSGSALGTVTLDRAGGAGLPPPGRWTIDPAHSAIQITARHMGLASVTGYFGEFSGTIEIAEPAEQSVVQAQIKAASIDTGSTMRDTHLRSPDFLDAESHPLVTYQSTGVTAGDGDQWTVLGVLTLRGTTRRVPLDLTYLGTGPDPWGGQRAAFQAQAELRRQDFDMDWNQSLASGALLVGAVLRITLDIEAVLGELPVLAPGASPPDPPTRTSPA
jgi:polyisoprenoid-binding protein YceI